MALTGQDRMIAFISHHTHDSHALRPPITHEGRHSLVLVQDQRGAAVAATVHSYTLDLAYKTVHLDFFFSFRVSRAARVACSKTSRTPSLVFAEHSRYFWAPIFLRTSSACTWVSGGWFAQGDLTDLLGSYGLLGSLVQLLDGLLIEAQILLAANEDDGQALAEMQDLGDPLGRC